jgi:cytochrome P450
VRAIGAALAEYEMPIVLRAILECAELSVPDTKAEKVKVRNITLARTRARWSSSIGR